MASIQNSGFFVLPTELRLGVYSHLLTTALAEGTASDIVCLYMSCSTIQAEMEILVTKVRQILDIKHTWDTDSQTKGVLRFELPIDYIYVNSPTNLRLHVPVPPACDWSRQANLLTPVLHLSLAVLRMGIYDPTSGSEIGVTRSLGSFCCLLQYQNGGRSADRPTFRQIDRLILQCGRKTDSSAETQTDRALELMVVPTEQMLVNVKVIWASRQDSRGSAMWELGFDVH
jgi:hypothetical protein